MPCLSFSCASSLCSHVADWVDDGKRTGLPPVGGGHPSWRQAHTRRAPVRTHGSVDLGGHALRRPGQGCGPTKASMSTRFSRGRECGYSHGRSPGYPRSRCQGGMAGLERPKSRPFQSKPSGDHRRFRRSERERRLSSHASGHAGADRARRACRCAPDVRGRHRDSPGFGANLELEAGLEPAAFALRVRAKQGTGRYQPEFRRYDGINQRRTACPGAQMCAGCVPRPADRGMRVRHSASQARERWARPYFTVSRR